MFDVHTHCIQPEDWGNEFARNWRPTYGYDWGVITPEAFDQAMSGVKTAIVFGLRATAAGVATPHTAVAKFCAAVSTDTIGFMALDPTDADIFEQMEQGVELGLRGIKLYPVLAHFHPADPQFDRFYEAATDKGLVLLWHMGATPSPAGDLAVSNPLVVDTVAQRHPELVQCIAHMGHPWQRDCVAVLRKNRRVFADVSGLFIRPMDAFVALVNAQEWGVVDKLLFGSDYPLWKPQEATQGLRRIAEMGSPGFPRVLSETIETIISANGPVKLGLREDKNPPTEHEEGAA